MKTINQKRKSSLTPMQIISELRRDSRQEFSPELLNEIGVTFLTAQESADRALAENVLIKALDVENMQSRFVAYCQLRRANGTASNEAHEAIELFKKNNSNKGIIEKAADKLWL